VNARGLGLGLGIDVTGNQEVSQMCLKNYYPHPITASQFSESEV